jgi:TPR repeat protein
MFAVDLKFFQYIYRKKRRPHILKSNRNFYTKAAVIGELTKNFVNKSWNIESVKIDAEKSIPEAQLMLGYSYWKGLQIEKDIEKSRDFFELSASQGNTTAKAILGSFYLGLTSEYSKLNVLKGVENMKNAGKLGHTASLLFISYCNLIGKYGRQETENSLRNLQKAEAEENGFASWLLGLLYQDGIHTIPADPDKSYCYYLKALSLGCNYAGISLANLYVQGIGVEKNLQKAIEYYQPLCDANESTALCNLALIYLEGDQSGIRRDVAKGFQLMSQSAQLGDPRGCYYLGFLYLKGVGTPADLSNCLKYFRKAAAKGHSPAFSYLVNLRREETISDTDLGDVQQYCAPITEYSYFYHLHSESLGLCYLHGYDGVPKDPTMAFKHLEIAARTRTECSVLLAQLYCLGVGAPQNLKKALRYYIPAADKGNTTACIQVFAKKIFTFEKNFLFPAKPIFFSSHKEIFNK